MAFYETVFMARQDLTDAQIKSLIEGYSKIIKDAGGKVHKTEHWGIRSLAYKINKASRAHYILIESDVSGDAIHEMERQMRINEDVIRYLTIKQEKLSDGPSIIMNKDRGDDYKSDKKEAA